MRKDYKKVKKLIERNEYFYHNNAISNVEYAANNLIFIKMLDRILKEDQRKLLKELLIDEFSLPKFRLSIEILKAAPN